VWTKHLQYYLDNANDASRTSKYSSFLGSQKDAVVRNGINASNDVSSTWYATNEGGGLFSAQSAASGLAALNAAAKVRLCCNNIILLDYIKWPFASQYGPC
jgi:hypothetical protein